MDALATAGGEAAGVELLAGLLAAGGHAAYFDACLAVVLGARGVPARDAGLTFLTRLPFEALPIDVTVEAMVQVGHEFSCHDLPIYGILWYAFLAVKKPMWKKPNLALDLSLRSAALQVTDDLNQAESARRDVPYALIQKLIQAPCSLSALRQVIATGTGGPRAPFHLQPHIHSVYCH